MYLIESRPPTWRVFSESLNDISFSAADILQAFDRWKGKASLPSDACKKVRQFYSDFIINS